MMEKKKKLKNFWKVSRQKMRNGDGWKYGNEEKECDNVEICPHNLDR